MNEEMKLCPHNVGVECETPNCECCGWYPPVAEKRLEEAMRTELYKIPFTGYCEVWARSPEEALEKADNEEIFYIEHVWGDPGTDKPEEDEEVSE